MDGLSRVAGELRAARDKLKLTREQLAERIGYSAGYIEKIETGKLPATESYIAAAMPTLGEGVDVAALFDRLRGDERRESAIPDWFRPWRDHEQEATEIRWFEPNIVPGLLQTEAYARALLGDEDRVAARLERQQVLDRAAVAIIIDESVLSRRIGDRPTMAEQLSQLATTTRAVVQVLPAAAETYLGVDGSFALATVDGSEVSYADTPLHGFVTSKAGVVSNVRRRWEALLAEALPRSASRAMILEVAETWKAGS